MDSNPNGKRPMTAEVLDQMAETPQRSSVHHRRAHSDTSFRLDDDLLLFDPSDFDFSALDFPAQPPPSAAPMAVDNSSDDSSSTRPQAPRHLRSLSVDSEFFDDLGFGDAGGGSGAVAVQGHRRSGSVDGDGMDCGLVKKAMGADKLAELALIDPKRAKRILANRQSAARSKERKTRYASELERKVQTLQTEATTLSAQVTMLQRDTSGLTTENKELKFRLQAMEQQTKLRDALNEALRDEVQRLKIATGQIQSVGGNPFGRPPQYSSQQQALHQFSSGQTQQVQSQQQFNMPQSASNNQNFGGQSQPNYFNFNERA